MNFEDVLDRYGELVYPNKGVSMLPLLREGRDLMVIARRPEGRCKKHDAVLFKRDNGQYVLHRIVKVREQDYLLCGDNQIVREAVREEQIIGVLNAVRRGDRTIHVTDWNYRLYVRVWTLLFPLRVAWFRLRGLAGKVKRRLFKNR
jgi:hypothetical protein